MTQFHSHRQPAVASRIRLGVELMEDRSVPAASILNGLFDPTQVNPSFGAATANIYTETNNPNSGSNAILGFHQDGNGSLTQFGTFATGGTGQLNIPKVVGPDDGDQEVQASADGRYLFAVNEGSNTVSAFRILPTGNLKLIGVFASGGEQPDSIGIVGDHLYVANRGDATQTHPGTIAPNVTGFDIAPNGALTPIPNSTVSFPVGTFVTQTLASPDGRFLFVEDATLSGTPDGNSINPFQIKADGALQMAPGGAVAAAANPSLLLGAAVNPYLNIVYAGLTANSQVGVFTYDETGRTSFVGASPDLGTAPCWCVVSPDARFLYVSNTATDSIGVYSLADPLHPVQIQDLVLGGPHSATGTGYQTAVFEIALDWTTRSLDVIGQSSDPTFPQGNQLHSLTVARDGTLTENTGPIILSGAEVPADAHPQGLAVVATGHEHWHDLIGQRFAGFDFGDETSALGQYWGHRHG